MSFRNSALGVLAQSQILNIFVSEQKQTKNLRIHTTPFSICFGGIVLSQTHCKRMGI